MNRCSRVGLRLIIMALTVVWTHTNVAASTPPAPAGLSAGAWRAIEAQLPPGRPSGMEQIYLKSSPMNLSNRFGTRVAMSGNTLVVSAPEEGGTGAVHVFVRVNGAWTWQSRFGASNAGPYDRFGSAIALDGDTLVVGATGEDSNGSSQADNSVESAGAAYVFVRNGGVWTQQAYLKPSFTGVQYGFGISVALDGDEVVVGATADDSTVAGGAAYVFKRTGTTWSKQGYLKASNAEKGDLFGFAVGIENGVVVVGATGERSNGSGPANNSAFMAGAAYIFERSNGTWSQRAYIKPPSVTGYDLFGEAVAMDGGAIVIGAPHLAEPCCQRAGALPADPAVLKTGEVFVYGRTTGPVAPTWTLQANLRASNADISDYFGGTVAIDGDTIVVGASGEDSNGSSPADNTDDQSGAAYVFRYNGSAWTELNYHKAFNLDRLDLFGYAVAIADGTMAVGAPEEAGNGSSPADNSRSGAGAVYVQQIGVRLAMPRLQR